MIGAEKTRCFALCPTNFWAMDYGTFFVTNIASVAVFAFCVSMLAWHNRKVTGMKWFSVSLIVGLIKLILQGLEGKLPSVLGSMVPNELYLISFALQLIGLHWFVTRAPLRALRGWLTLALPLATYTVMFLGKIRYSGNVINIPSILVCGASAWILLKHGQTPFTMVSRVTVWVLCSEMLVMSYRAWLTNMRYMRPWETINAHTDPRWLYSLAGMAFLATCMVMCNLWFMVTELERVLDEQAHTDPLTGALNRRAMEEAALRETARSIRHGHPLSVIVFDVDHFKHLNDTRGHAAGDSALTALVKEVKKALRIHDLLARTGGEEFTILLPNTPASSGVQAAERVRGAIEALEVPFEHKPIRFTVSAGVAEFDPSKGDWENMMRRADAAMYHAKEHGRNSVQPAPGEPEVAPVGEVCVPLA